MVNKQPPQLRKATKGERRLLTSIATFFCASLVLGVVALVNIVSIQSEYSASVKEYDIIRENYAPIAALPDEQTPLGAPEQPEAPNPHAGLLELNPEYVGWITVPGTAVDYPVVQAPDNDKYLHTGFSGEDSKSGTVFMDHRCDAEFFGPYTILYGHNMKNGSMFAALNEYINNEAFLEAHPLITIATAQNKLKTYRIFNVQRTDAYDPAYSLAFSDGAAVWEHFEALGVATRAPEVLSLSTCTNTRNDLERLLIHAVLVTPEP